MMKDAYTNGIPYTNNIYNTKFKQKPKPNQNYLPKKEKKVQAKTAPENQIETNLEKAKYITSI